MPAPAVGRTPPTPGVSWMPERGRLYRFTRDAVTVIQPWPAPRCWIRRHGGPWRSGWPGVRLELLGGGGGVPYPYRFEHDAWTTVPAAVRQQVLRSSCIGAQWSSLGFLARCADAPRLVDELPLLAAAAANLRQIRAVQEQPGPARPWRALRAATRGPRSRDTWRRVTTLLRWPTEPSFLRALRRPGPLAPEAWRARYLGAIPTLWRVSWLRKLLQHGPPLSPGRLAALAAAADLARRGGRLPPRLFLDQEDDHGAHNLAGAIRALDFAWEGTAHHRFPHPASLSSLEAIERATEALLPSPQRQGALPPPPLTGTASIVPLRTPQALRDEGTRMGHCIGVGGFAARARAMTGFAYSVRDPDTGAPVATAWIEPSPRQVGAFSLGQLQGPRNTPVAPPVRTAVQQWLADSAHAHRLRRQGVPDQDATTAPAIHGDWAPAPGMDATTWTHALRRQGRGAQVGHGPCWDPRWPDPLGADGAGDIPF